MRKREQHVINIDFTFRDLLYTTSSSQLDSKAKIINFVFDQTWHKLIGTIRIELKEKVLTIKKPEET